MNSSDAIRRRELDPADVPAGIVGLGLMGTSIAACLLAAGHRVAGVEADASKRRIAARRVLALLGESRKEGLLRGIPSEIIKRLHVGGDYIALKGADIVIECVTESVEAKREVLHRVEEVVSPKTLIGSNTSAIPITDLQQGALRPERIMGIHWAEPAHATRFMEIICGKGTRPAYAKLAFTLARRWGKEPSLLRRDVRGFLTNRCMYAMMREAFHLVESGYATIAEVDRSLRNDLGYWITFAGPFRIMDLTGIPAYEAVMRDLLPDLSCAKEVPPLLRKLVQSGAQGVSNCKGFYHYTPAQARRWERRFRKFTYEIRALAGKYPEDGADRPRRASQ
ncbi:MAG: 3-hydroxyacyl-CoA dehydrogenase family protein [Acidobacteriota bacterium]